MVIPEKPLGGTELMYNELLKRIDSKILEKISLFNYIKDADFNKTTVYWNQLSFDQDAVQFLRDEDIKNRIDFFVFVSHWQAEIFRKTFNIPGYKTFVIRNAAIDIAEKSFTETKPVVKVAYTSTPWRGLHILLDSWEKLNPENSELHIFSSTQIYGSDFYNTTDQSYQHLYEKAKNLPGVVYRGFVNNEDLRKELTSFDILAYPCTFEETSCISVIEALSAGLKVVCSNIGALPETTEGWANLYTYRVNPEMHVNEFVNELDKAISGIKSGIFLNSLKDQVQIYRKRWSWDTRISEWNTFLEEVSNLTTRKEENWTKTIFDEVYTDNEYNVGQLTSNDIVIDIGAHVGAFAKRCLDNGAGHVYSFEPSQTNFPKLTETLKEYTNVTISNLAVWSKSGLNISFSNKRNMDITNTALSTAFTRNGDSRVETISLDDIISKFDRVRLLKIDVEGSEYPILLNSKHLSRVDEIVGELHEINEENSLMNPLSWTAECNMYSLLEHLVNSGFDVTTEKTAWPHTLMFRALKKNST